MSPRQDELERELRHRLRAELESTFIDTPSASRVLEWELRRIDRRRRVAAVAVAAVAAVVVAVLAVVVRADVDPRPEPATPPGERTVWPLEDISVRKPFFYDLGTGAVRQLPSSLKPASLGRLSTGHGEFHYDVSPDGSQVAYICHDADSDCVVGEDGIVVAALDGTVHHVWPLPFPLSTDRVAWSPDGRSIAYALHSHGSPGAGGLFVQDVATGERTRLVDPNGPSPGPDTDGGGVAFTADGQTVLFTGGSPDKRSSVWSVPVTGGKASLVFSNAADPFRLPGGGHGFLAEGSPAGTDLVVDQQSTRRTLVHSDQQITWPTVSPDGTRIVYLDYDQVMMVDVTSGVTTPVAQGRYSASWVNDQTLLMTPVFCC